MSARSAKTGKYVTGKFAQANKATTVVEGKRKKPKRASAGNGHTLKVSNTIGGHVYVLTPIGSPAKAIKIQPGKSAQVQVGPGSWLLDAIGGSGGLLELEHVDKPYPKPATITISPVLAALPGAKPRPIALGIGEVAQLDVGRWAWVITLKA